MKNVLEKISSQVCNQVWNQIQIENSVYILIEDRVSYQVECQISPIKNQIEDQVKILLRLIT